MPDLVIATDTREQTPLVFEGATIERKTLKTGDYSIVGLEDVIAVERKSLADLVSTVVHNQDRFRRELLRLFEIKYRCIVVEGDLPQLFARQYHGRANPRSVLGLLLAMMIDYNVPVLFCSTPELAATTTHSFLKRAYKRATAEV